MTTDRDDLHPDVARTAAELPCYLPAASGKVFEPFLAGLSADVRHQFNAMARAMAVLGDRLTVLILVDLPDDGDALIAGLTLRSWLLGVTASSRRLAEATDDGGLHPDAAKAAATLQLRARYERDPRAARNDGLDVVAGGLLDG